MKKLLILLAICSCALSAVVPQYTTIVNDTSEQAEIELQVAKYRSIYISVTDKEKNIIRLSEFAQKQ